VVGGFDVEQPALDREAARVADHRTVGPDDPVARHDDEHWIERHSPAAVAANVTVLTAVSCKSSMVSVHSRPEAGGQGKVRSPGHAGSATAGLHRLHGR
jgi:hypothetical protein